MITRRSLLASAAATPPAVALAGALNDPGLAIAPAAVGKNILIFITDQERKIQHFPKGWEKENLPGLTRLKRHGVTFENAFCNACMCSPSRATLFTGLYPAQHGVKYTLEEDMPAEDYPQVELPTDLTNLATVMTAAGYDVVFKGKWHLSKPLGADWTPEDLEQYGFAGWDPPDAGANQDIDQAGGGTTDNDGRYMNGDQGVLDFIASRAENETPWCMVVSLVNPHDVLFYPGPRNSDPPKYEQAGYSPDDGWFDGDIGLPVTWDEDLSTKPDAQEEFVRLFGLAGRPRTREQRLGYLNFYGNLMKLVDGYLVDVLDALQDIGQLGDTIVVRTSDHGEMGLAHTMQQKNFNVYEETMRVPLVFSNPELFRNARSAQQMVSHVDLLPTLAGLVDAPEEARNPEWRGVDYSDQVLERGAGPTQDEIIFTYDDWQAGQKNGPYVRPPNHIVAIRERRWKLAKYYDESGKKPPQWEMYDLEKDPLERRNIAHRPDAMTDFQREQFRRLKRRLRRAERTELQPLDG